MIKKDVACVLPGWPGKCLLLFSLFLIFSISSLLATDEGSGERLYKHLTEIVNDGNNEIIESLNTVPRALDWSNSDQMEFNGHLRYLHSPEDGSMDQTRLYFIRSAAEGDVYILTIPDREDPGYAGLEDLI